MAAASMLLRHWQQDSNSLNAAYWVTAEAVEAVSLTTMICSLSLSLVRLVSPYSAFPQLLDVAESSGKAKRFLYSAASILQGQLQQVWLSVTSPSPFFVVSPISSPFPDLVHVHSRMCSIVPRSTMTQAGWPTRFFGPYT